MAAHEGRVALFSAPDQPFELRTFRLDGLEPGQVLVKIHQTNICGSDLHAWHGNFALRGLGGHFPTVLGHEMVGSVADTGSDVRDADGKPLTIGDRIVFPYFHPCHECRNCLLGRSVSCLRLRMAMLDDALEAPHFVGGFGDYYVLPAGAVIYRVPDDLSDELVAGLNCALAQVLYGLERVAFRFGETIVIQGAGGLGLYAVALARAHGAGTIIVVDAIEERLDLARRFGADHVINASEVADAGDRARQVRDLTDGFGADVVAELVGSPTVVAEGIKMLGQGGRYLEIGNISLGRTYEADPSRLTLANKSIVGVCLYEPPIIGKALAFLARHKDALPLDLLGQTTFRLEDINEAFGAADRREVIRASIVP